MIYIGIDPGVSGGIAAVLEDGRILTTSRMPETERDLLGVLDAILERAEAGQARAVIEKVHAGVFAAPGRRMGVVSAFTFGKGYGRLLMALTAVRIPFDEVLPATWQVALGCRSRGDKAVTKRRAQQLFPSVPITHAIADALLMAEFCRRVERGSVQRTRRRA